MGRFDKVKEKGNNCMLFSKYIYTHTVRTATGRVRRRLAARSQGRPPSRQLDTEFPSPGDRGSQYKVPQHHGTQKESSGL